MEKLKTKKKETKIQQNSGITLIALVVTIIVLLILAGISIAMLTGQNGILNRASEAKRVSGTAQTDEQVKIAVGGALAKGLGTISYNDLKDELDERFDEYSLTPAGESESWALEVNGLQYTITGTGVVERVGGSLADNTSGNSGNSGNSGETGNSGNSGSTGEQGGTGGETGNISPKVSIGGEEITLTPQNVRDYMGKIVTNYKTPNSSETITISGKDIYGQNEYPYEDEYTVSTTYRLYYVDFENKYGDGYGTVYLKADFCGSSDNCLHIDGTASKSKIARLNPALYDNGVLKSPLSNDNPNIKEVTWLLDSEKWSGLKSGLNIGISSSDVNYVVGAPSVELFVDSYNFYYNLTVVDEKVRNANSDRTKIFCFYPTEEEASAIYFPAQAGYMCGPATGYGTGYDVSTSPAIFADNSIGSMYYPGNNAYAYWLASPSAYYNIYGSTYDYVMAVSGYYLTQDGNGSSNTRFCPLVSLKPSALLTLQNTN